MEYTIDWCGEGPYDVVITSRGLATREDFFRALDDLVGDPRHRPGLRQLVDHSALDPSGLTSHDVRAVADRVEGLEDRLGLLRLAIVVSDPLGFGLVRMWQAYVDGRTRATTRVFYSRDEALAWLEDGPGV